MNAQALAALLLSSVVLTGCGGDAPTRLPARRSFRSGFESVDDFVGFYLTPQGHLGSTFHGKSTEQVRAGTSAHKAWVTRANETGPGNTNHRGYPTIQLHKSPQGTFVCPCRVELYVWLDMPLAPGEWFSFATFTGDTSDDWDRTVLVNLSDEGFVHLMHVPTQGDGKRLFQTTTRRFPQRTWVKLEIELDLSARGGLATVWQDGEKVSQARVEGFRGELAQAHFGLYAPPSVASGVIFNDELSIRELSE